MALKFGVKRPYLHYVIIGGYVISPLANIALYMATYQLPLKLVIQNFFTLFGTLSGIVMLLAPLVGLGLFFVHRASFYAFVAHSALVIVDNLFKLVQSGGVYQGSLLAGSLVFIAIIGYVLQRDFRAPYFQALPRSWREGRRIAIHHYITVAGQQYEIDDLSATGCFMHGELPILAVGEKVDVELTIANEGIAIRCRGEVMRKNPSGMGLRFIGIDAPGRSAIRRFFKHKFPLRYRVDHPGVLVTGETRDITIVDMSSGGCFIATPPAHLHVGEKCYIRLVLGEEHFEITGRIVWKNSGEFIKPHGAGIEFSGTQRRLMRVLSRVRPGLELTR